MERESQWQTSSEADPIEFLKYLKGDPRKTRKLFSAANRHMGSFQDLLRDEGKNFLTAQKKIATRNAKEEEKEKEGKRESEGWQTAVKKTIEM